jgi:hypothetical protein
MSECPLLFVAVLGFGFLVFWKFSLKVDLFREKKAMK